MRVTSKYDKWRISGSTNSHSKSAIIDNVLPRSMNANLRLKRNQKTNEALPISQVVTVATVERKIRPSNKAGTGPRR